MPRDENRPGSRTVTRRRTGRYSTDPISLGLRKLWNDIEQEPVPGEFLDLLDAIDTASSEDGAPDDTKLAGNHDGDKP